MLTLTDVCCSFESRGSTANQPEQCSAALNGHTNGARVADIGVDCIQPRRQMAPTPYTVKQVAIMYRVCGGACRGSSGTPERAMASEM